MIDVDKLKVGDKLFNRPIVKITEKCIYITPGVPGGTSRYTKKYAKEWLKDY